jgi:hypothetical protein
MPINNIDRCLAVKSNLKISLDELPVIPANSQKTPREESLNNNVIEGNSISRSVSSPMSLPVVNVSSVPSNNSKSVDSELNPPMVDSELNHSSELKEKLAAASRDEPPVIPANSPAPTDEFLNNNVIEGNLIGSTSKIVNSELNNLSQLVVKPKEDLEKEKLAAAIKIQSIFRGILVQLAVKKEERHLLSYSLLEQVKPLIDEPKKFENLPRAASGRTPVYLLNDLSIVIKQSGSPKNNIRFDKMRQAREICDASNYSHLVIPRARIYRDCIMEKRLPISENHDTKMQIGFYLDHVEKFTEAVKEFTGFLCQAKLNDITGGTNDAYSTLSEVPIGRYDNVAMYLKEGIGKLGLIDLEEFDPKSESQRREGFSACIQAIRLFPHHLEAIIGVAKNFDPNIENYRKQLETERDEVLEYFKKAYQNHLDFVQQKNINFTDPTKFDQISEDRKNKIIKVIEDEILKQNQNHQFKNCLGETPDTTIKVLNETGVFPKILEITLEFITNFLKTNLQEHGGPEAISSYSKLISVRTLEFDSSSFNKLKKSIAKNLSQLKFKIKNKDRQFASTIITAIFKELAEGKEIAYYNPSFGVGTSAVHCIFC